MSYALVASNDNELYTVGSMSHSTSQYPKFMFWSLAPAIVIVPVFVVCGKMLLGGSSSISPQFLLVVAPLCLAYHVVLFSLAFVKNRKRFFNDAAEYCLSQQASHLLALYYLCHIGIQLFVSHWDTDEGLVGSIMTTRFGLDPDVADDGLAFFGNAAILLAVALFIHVFCFEKIEIVKTASGGTCTTPAAAGPQIDMV